MMTIVKRWLLAFLVPKPIVGMLYLPRYLRHWFEYRAMALSDTRPEWRDSYPCLTVWYPSTPFDPHYFYQGAWLARHLTLTKPTLHVDIGSSAMMLSVMSAQVRTVFVDYRPLRAGLEDLICLAGNALRLPFATESLPSLSSLHVLEHVGLGRYGDALDPLGSVKAAVEFTRVVSPGGRLYVSVPTGRDRTCFNAHRVFSPATLQRMFPGLELESFALVDDRGSYLSTAEPEDGEKLDYGCGMYVFVKPDVSARLAGA